MTGTAKVKFRCGAKLTEKEHFGSFGLFEATCSNRIKADLVNDGQYTNFNVPEGWHIELGVFDPSKTIVRCPRHCHWKYPRGLPELGEWVDAE